jgi:hypothetical protein
VLAPQIQVVERRAFRYAWFHFRLEEATEVHGRKESAGDIKALG